MEFHVRKTSKFTPVIVKITLNTPEEAAEFQIRMDLSLGELRDVRPHSVNEFTDDNHTTMKGITSFRRELRKSLGDAALDLMNNSL